MADAPTIGSVLATVVPVVVGGVLTLAGGAVTQWYLHRAKTAEDRQIRRREKFESLVTAVYEYDHWLEEMNRKRVWGEHREPGMSPFAKIQAIAAIYFPQFDDSFTELRRLGFAYERWMFDAAMRRLNKSPNIAQNIEAAYKPYIGKRDAIMNEFRQFASRGNCSPLCVSLTRRAGIERGACG